MDGFGSTFTSSDLYQNYLKQRADLVPNSATAYAKAVNAADFAYWITRLITLKNQVQQPSTSSSWSNPNYTRAFYSISLWAVTKTWEVNQEFGLEGMARVAFGANAPAERAWYSMMPFDTSPFMANIPEGAAGFVNGTGDAHIYFSFAWYHTQLVLNDGNGTAVGTWPIDWGYSLAYLGNGVPWNDAIKQARVGDAGLLLEWETKALQSGNIVESTTHNMTTTGPSWIEVSRAQEVQELTIVTSNWLTAFKRYTPAQLLAWLGTGTMTRWAGQIQQTLPVVRYVGVDPSLLNQMVTALSAVWPTINWTSVLNETCTVNIYQTVNCH